LVPPAWAAFQLIAVEEYGLGKGINRFEDARAGDFMDISRTNGTGHTVIFQNWIRNGKGLELF
jgi:hypothetical protein